jgi:hypothetical protein
MVKKQFLTGELRLVLIQREDSRSSRLRAGAKVPVRSSILMQERSFAPSPFLLRLHVELEYCAEVPYLTNLIYVLGFKNSL